MNIMYKDGIPIGGVPQVYNCTIPNMVKLWENPNPASAYAGGDITLSSSDYDFLMIEYRYSTGTDGRKSVIAAKGTPIIWMDMTNNTYNGVIGITRALSRQSDTSFTFGNAYTATGTSGQSTDSTVAIPTAIYGFKKDIDLNAIVANVSTSADKCMLSDNITSVEDALSIESGTATGEVGKTTITVQAFKKIGKLVIFTLAFSANVTLAPADIVFTLPWTPDSRYDFIGAVGTINIGIACTFFTSSSTKQVQFNTGTITSSAVVFVSGSYVTTD